jgi:hypothetical protein
VSSVRLALLVLVFRCLSAAQPLPRRVAEFPNIDH